MKFNGTTLTKEVIIAARQWFIDNRQGCIDEVKNGTVKLPDHVNPQDYFDRCEAQKREYENGLWGHTFTFLQRAYWIQTGESIALLP